MKILNLHTLASLALLAGLILAVGCQQSDEEEDQNPLSEEEQESVQVRPEVIFAVADDQPLYQYIESQGVVEANQQATLKPRVSGFIEQSNLAEGRKVQKGDTLLEFVDEEWRLSYQQAKNEYQRVLRDYEEYRSMEGMVETNGQKMDKELVRINTGLAQAELDLKRAELDLSYTNIIAPFSGVLHTERRINPGSYITSGTEIGQLIDDRRVRVRFDVLESEIGMVREGMVAELTSPGGQTLSGRVVGVAPVVDSESKTGQVVVEANNSAQLLRPGMTVEGAIRVEEISGKARVPRSAILSRDGGRTLLFKLRPENDEVHWIYVNPTAQNADWAIIDHEDVAPGDTIAVERHFALSHLQIVTPKMKLSTDDENFD